jgi:hypothetical protein
VEAGLLKEDARQNRNPGWASDSDIRSAHFSSRNPFNKWLAGQAEYRANGCRAIPHPEAFAESLRVNNLKLGLNSEAGPAAR